MQKGMQGQALRFPVAPAQENKAQKLDQVLPILGTPIKLKLREYLPDLAWETSAVADPDAGAIARLMIRGPNFERQRWLTTDDLKRKALTSKIGRVRLEKMHDHGRFAHNVEQLADPKCIGLLSVRRNDAAGQDSQPQTVIQEYAVRLEQKITLPNSKYIISVLDYFPHYSRDSKKQTDLNLSEKPVNPALKVKIEGGPEAYEKWLWARLLSFGHANHPGSADTTEPLDLVFTRIDALESNTHTIVVAPRQEAVILIPSATNIHPEKLTVGKQYPFNEEYSFTVEEILTSAKLVENWKNRSETLRAPAVIVELSGEKSTEQVVLELNQPQHVKSDDETIVLMLTQQKKPDVHGN